MKNLSKSLNQATELHKKGKISEALEIYLEINKVNKNNPEILFQIGNAYLQKNNKNLAVDF